MAANRPSDAAFEGRETRANSGGGITEARNRGGWSSYPHVTPATPATPGTLARAEHVTDVRRVATVTGSAPGQRFEILQRFHQDNVAGATPEHDRYIAADAETGRVHTVRAALNPDVHQPHRAAVPERGLSLSDTRRVHLTFTVEGETGDPPLSPRTRRRSVRDEGY
ncbi:hypothetical protein [Trinickia dinghuensis]|uniref:Uncharacterized protein n=1 Tax=Trinickia dinghuensis TaxID=2291023 RepID=A0A3D8JNZ0_9BURK|nr:hypothetical protein [Trinickia dinghuensis]RDU94728.1 hypothetical protein DWV00_32510 [Trinickia dinghuensis]